MARRKKEENDSNLADLMQAFLIAELGRAGVTQAEIRKIVGCGITRVNQIVKPIERERRRIGKAEATRANKLERKLDTIVRLSKRSAQ